MIERLIIRNFAGLEEVDIELGRINIFIGPQASGKSVCAKCLYWFKSFGNELLAVGSAGKDKKHFDNGFLSRFKEYFPNIWRSTTPFLIRYELNNLFIQLAAERGKLVLSYSSLLQEAGIKLRTESRRIEEKYSKLHNRRNGQLDLGQYMEEIQVSNAIRAQLWNIGGPLVAPYQSFVLAGRSFFSVLKGAVLTFLASTTIADPFLRDFIRLYENSRRLQPEIEIPKSIHELAKLIIKGSMVSEGEEDFVISDDGRKVALSNASSGQQEVFPLLLILLSLLWQDDYKNEIPSPQVVYIEEPEAHLFPQSQRAIAQLMSEVYCRSFYHLQYVITTHSPYLLASFNNLIYAHQLAQTLLDQPAQLKALYKVVPKNQQLALADVRVYGFENGRVKSLIDEETGLLQADLLDSASDVTADQFGALMALDPAIHS
jgi:predicted ATPase